jgi:hypothetical protein
LSPPSTTAKGIQSIDDYLDVLARYRFGSPTIEAETLASPPGGPGHSLRGWLAKRETTVRDLLLVAVLGGLIVGVVLWLLLG